jgi:hypothetical protein
MLGAVPAPAYNKGVHESLVSAARKGLPKRACAGNAGIGVRAFQRWLERGRRAADAHEEGEECLAEDEKYIQLYRDVERAVALRMAELLDEIDNNDEKVGMWMRKAWLLERAWPDEFGPPATRVVHEGEVTHRNTLELPQETQLAMHELFSQMTKPKELKP